MSVPAFGDPMEPSSEPDPFYTAWLNATTPTARIELLTTTVRQGDAAVQRARQYPGAVTGQVSTTLAGYPSGIAPMPVLPQASAPDPDPVRPRRVRYRVTTRNQQRESRPRPGTPAPEGQEGADLEPFISPAQRVAERMARQVEVSRRRHFLMQRLDALAERSAVPSARPETRTRSETLAAQRAEYRLPLRFRTDAHDRTGSYDGGVEQIMHGAAGGDYQLPPHAPAMRRRPCNTTVRSRRGYVIRRIGVGDLPPVEDVEEEEEQCATCYENDKRVGF